MSHEHSQPVDMNAAFARIAHENFHANAGALIANALIASGNALRNQAFAMMSQIPTNEIMTKPALLADGSSLVLLPYFRPVAGFFRLVGTYSASGERVLVAFVENEAEVLKTGFLNFTEEQLAELNRQLDLLNFKNEGTKSVEVGLMLVEKPVEGYEYFKAEAPAEVIEVKTDGSAATGDAVAHGTPPAPTAPVALDSVINDVAPGAAPAVAAVQ